MLGLGVLHVLAACVIITAPTLKPTNTLIISLDRGLKPRANRLERGR